MSTAAQRRLTGGEVVATEPHPITRVLTGRQAGRPLGWYCGTCEGELRYGRDGRYRHAKGAKAR